MPRFPRLAFRLPRLPRLSVKAMMGIVALIALTFGLGIELQNRQGRDRNAETEATHRAHAAWHERQASDCAAALAANRPYSFRDRVQVQRQAVKSLGVADYQTALASWAAEQAYHHEQVRRLTADADEAAAQKQYYQRRLLVPF